MSTTLAGKYTMGLAALAAATGMVFAAAAPASAAPVTRGFNIACNATSGSIVENVSEPFSVTTNDLGGNQWSVQTGKQTTPGSAFGYTFVSLTKLKVVYEVADPDNITSVTLGANLGKNYTGTPQVKLVGNKIILDGTGAGLSVVGGNIEYQMPEIIVTQTTGPLDLKFSTTGVAGQYGNSANNFFTFDSNVTAWIVGAKTAATTCIPADGIQTVVGSYPTLNTGALPLP